MRAEEILQQIEPWRSACKRLAWTPVTEAREGGVMASKFSGMPWLAQDEPYPCCGSCNAPLPLLLQLNLDDLPQPLAGQFGRGLLQLFYCLEEDCGDYQAFSDVQVARIVQPSDCHQVLQAGEYPSLPPATIVGWNSLDDYPNPQDHEATGLVYDYDCFADVVETVKIHCPLAGLNGAELPVDENEYAPEAEEMAEATDGDKLAGYPRWVQDTEYPNCPICNRQMELVFQLNSEDHLPVMFGDVGRGHITQCPDHKEVVTFAWACS